MVRLNSALPAHVPIAAIVKSVTSCCIICHAYELVVNATCTPHKAVNPRHIARWKTDSCEIGSVDAVWICHYQNIMTTFVCTREHIQSGPGLGRMLC